jgi:hypothetical protein
LTLSEQQIETLSPNPAAYKAGQSLSARNKWSLLAKSERAIWGEIKGSGKDPYQIQIDINTVAYKCNCPSRQFPCKHSIALMLLSAKLPDAFEQLPEEPAWVKTWLDKRLAKANKPEQVEEPTPEEQDKSDKAREKTQAERFEAAQAGAAELALWLKDMVRIGILDLPSKPLSEFEKVAARMVDSKAPGLASWVKSLSKLDFENQNEWQSNALTIISKLYLLIRTFQNYDNLDPIWQITIKNLVGWSQSTKELLANTEAETIKDKWLVAGQEVETNDDISTQRNWLVGCHSNRKALILNFGTKFTPLENTLIPGSIVNAELAFFPSALPYRAAVKMQRSLESEMEHTPSFFDSWREVCEFKSSRLNIHPWTSEFIILLKDIKLVRYQELWIVHDREKSYFPVVAGFDLQKVMKWLAISGNRPQNAACILQYGKVLPLGIFQDNHYILL